MRKSQPTNSTELLEQLSRNSTPYMDALSRVDWEALDTESFWLPEEALSLYGLPVYQTLTHEQRIALSQFEFLHVLEAGLWLEGIFMERISRTIQHTDAHLGRLIYHLHELREEAGHSLMFLEVMRRSGLPRPRTRFYRMLTANLVGRYAPFDSTAFWIAVLIGEEVPDRLNRFIRKHREAVNPAIYDVTKVHIIDEARHIAHALDTLAARFASMPRWRMALLKPLIKRLFRQFVRTLYFPSASVYDLAGLSPNTQWERLARNNPHRIRFVDDNIASTLRTLKAHGIVLDWH